jgi:hypothetical protein
MVRRAVKLGLQAGEDERGVLLVEEGEIGLALAC